jgi:micrococcal nuclease
MYEYRINITRIVDGDTVDGTIDLGFNVSINVRVRLAGIDAPESRTSNPDEKVYGLEAKEELIRLTSEDINPIIIKSHGLGKFGRVLGTLYINDVNINQDLIDRGYVIEYQGSKKISVPDMIKILNEVRDGNCNI